MADGAYTLGRGKFIFAGTLADLGAPNEDLLILVQKVRLAAMPCR